MELQEYKDILKNYYEGLTSLEEESKLKSFLVQYSGDDTELVEAKVFFDIVNDDSKKTIEIDFESVTNSNSTIQFRKLYMVLSGVAASLIIAISLTFLFTTSNSPIVYAYIDGQPITNKQEAIKYSQQALLSIQSNLNKGTKGLDYMDKLNKPIELLTVKN